MLESIATDDGASPCIGVFDSGVGGLSILRALRERMPNAPFLYLGDVAHAPYGDRSVRHVADRCARIVDWLTKHGAAMIVVACNTATLLAIDRLRARWPNLVFVGVEPGVKLAISRSRSRRIAVMTTAATATSARLQQLIAKYAETAYVHVQPCPGLVDEIERGDLQGAYLINVLTPYCDAMRTANVDIIALGCTHYPFIESSIRDLMGPEVTVIDTANAVAERCASLWKSCTVKSSALPTLRVFSSGSTVAMQRLLELCPALANAQAEVLTMIRSPLPE